MSSDFLYLLGAGASNQVLPLLSDFARRLHSFAIDLKRAKPKASLNDPIWGKARNKLVEAIGWLANEASHHFSVDTLAKKLFFRNDQQSLKKLKAALSAYLVTEQSRQYVDKRYDAFFASILQFDEARSIGLPQHLRILTWNYDTQLEKAFYGFCQDDDLVLKGITFNDKIYRVNGYCGTHPPGHAGACFRAVWKANINEAWEAGISLYNEYFSDPSAPEPDIKFAWEDATHNRLKNTFKNLPKVLTIVVIGYSFPYFNRQIDDLIFKQFYSVDRVYLQFPEGKHAAAEERVKNLLPPDTEIVRVMSTDLFYVPDEFR